MKGIFKMKVKINQKNDTITANDIHCSKESLSKMIESINQNIQSPIYIDRIDSYKKTFLISYGKSLRQRKFYSD